MTKPPEFTKRTIISKDILNALIMANPGIKDDVIYNRLIRLSVDLADRLIQTLEAGQ
jgi:hypothetical protein